ncbi:MAG: hypothetical protein F6K03_02685 [Kamptonema sp. SIO4C4]|nr:hypothetical protein [Kamptonema sp. SIO4C4]
MSGLQNSFFTVLGQLPVDHLVLAQNVEDPQVLNQIQSWFSNFVSSGQLTTLIIGFVIGFAFRSLTAS